MIMRHLFSFLTLTALLPSLLSSCGHQGTGERPSDIDVAELLIQNHKDSFYLYPDETVRHLTAVRKQLSDSSALGRIDLMLGVVSLYRGDRTVLDSQSRWVGAYCAAHPDDHALAGLYWNNIGLAEMMTGGRDSAIKCFTTSWREMELACDTTRACEGSINLAGLLRERGDMAAAVGVLRDAALLGNNCDRVLLTTRFAVRYMQAAIYSDIYSFGLADSCFRAAAKLMDHATPSDKYMFYNARGNRYFFDRRYDKAWADFVESEKLARQLRNKALEAIALSNMGEVLHGQGRNREALPLLLSAERAMKEAGAGSAQPVAYLNDLMASVLTCLGDREGAAQRFRDTDTAAIADNPKYMMTHYERLADYYRLQGDNARAYDCLQRARDYESRFRDKIFTEQLAEAQLRYQRDLKVMVQETELQRQRKHVTNLRVGFVLIVLVAVFVVAFVVWSQRRKRQLLLLRFQKQLTQLSLQNIRNRLSPHFIMNVLGRELSVGNEGIARLIKFIRQNLMLVSKTVIPLEEEIDFVNTYVELERKSLSRDFVYACDVDDAIDVKATLVPAMILQVFVENAVKHGLRGQQGEVFLRVSVTQDSRGIGFCVDNNGSDAQTPEGTHTGLSVVRQTVDLFNKHNQQPILLDYGPRENGLWHVEISIPTGYNFMNLKD